MTMVSETSIAEMTCDKPLTDDTTPIYKRCLDLAVIAVFLPLLVPVFLAIAVFIRLDSPGTVFFRQTRIGRNGKPFTMLKFRSMYADAEHRRSVLVAQSDRAGACFKMAHDPRVTGLGRLLRRSSLDELPQLINVLLGEMSLVGPRPGLSEEVRAYSPRDRQRLQALPGISGLWQVAGRADLSFEEMIELDLSYIARAGLWMDLTILWRTVAAVITGRGAY